MSETTRATAIVTGASSGVGLYATQSLVARGWHVVMACRDLDKARRACVDLGIASQSVKLLHLELGSLAAVRQFAKDFAGRQGPGARTHLVSPAMAAAAAVTGRLADVRELV